MVTYAPHFISVVVMVGIIFQMLDPRIGIVNIILKAFGFEAVNWLGDADYFRSIYVWSGVWQNVGFSCIIYLAHLPASIRRFMKQRWWTERASCGACGISIFPASCRLP